MTVSPPGFKIRQESSHQEASGTPAAKFGSYDVHYSVQKEVVTNFLRHLSEDPERTDLTAIEDRAANMSDNLAAVQSHSLARCTPVCDAIAKCLPARDILSLSCVNKSMHQEGAYRNKLWVEALVEGYFTCSPATQASYKHFITSNFGDQHTPSYNQWLDRHFTQDEQAWLKENPLRVRALFRCLSNRFPKLKRDSRLEGHSSSVHYVLTMPDGRLVSSAQNSIIKVWDLTKKHSRKRCVTTLQDYVFGALAVTVLPDGRLVTDFSEKTLKVWDLSKPAGQQCVATLEGHRAEDGNDGVSCLTVLPDGRLVSGYKDGTIEIWDLSQPAGQQCITTWKAHIGSIIYNGKTYGGYVNCVTVLPDGRLVSGSQDQTLKVWDLSKPPGLQYVATLEGHTGSVTNVIVLPDGRLASSCCDNTLKVWGLNKPAGQQCVATLEGHGGGVRCCIVLPDGRLVSCSEDATLRVWDLSKPAGQQCVITLRGHAGTVWRITVLPDGRLVSCSHDKTLMIWNLDHCIRK